MSPNASYKLYQFRHSHFSEKARWALDLKRVPYETVNLVRGPHAKVAKRLGVANSTVPILEISTGEVIQDSTAILDWLENQFPDGPSLEPASAVERAEASQLEELFDETLGYHTRRLLYACLLDHPKVVSSVFLQGKPKALQLVYPFVFYPMRRRMRRELNLGPGAVDESAEAMEVAFQEIDRRLEGGAAFLVGNQFSRADLTAAALLSAVTWPPEFDFDWPPQELVPQELKTFRQRVRQRPFYRWASNLYGKHRLSPGA